MPQNEAGDPLPDLPSESVIVVFIPSGLSFGADSYH